MTTSSAVIAGIVSLLIVGGCGSDQPGPAIPRDVPPAAGELTVTPAAGRTYTSFEVAMTTTESTGTFGDVRRHYTVRIRGPQRPACVIDRDVRLPDADAGTRVRIRLSPRRGGKGKRWCRGVFRGTVTFFEGYACPARGTCREPPGFPTRTEVVDGFVVRVR